eukprot:scaffold123216_cov36-Cyclotella_meneghiniana.AAC.1
MVSTKNKISTLQIIRHKIQQNNTTTTHHWHRRAHPQGRSRGWYRNILGWELRRERWDKP